MSAIPVPRRRMSGRRLSSLMFPVVVIAFAVPALWQGFGEGGATPAAPVGASASGSGTSIEVAAAAHRTESPQAPTPAAGTTPAASEERQRFFRFLLLYGAGARPFGVFK